MKYLVSATSGPSFSTPEEMTHVLKDMVLPTLDTLAQLEKSGTIRGGGLPVGDRAFVFVVDASSNAELDQMLRNLPMWPAMQWKVTALEDFAGRAAQERGHLKDRS